MSSKPTRGSTASSSSSGADPIRESAHEIWLAGLGAFTKAQQEGGKMFDALVQEGLAMQRKAQTTAEEKLSEASQKMSSLAQEIESRATGQWDKLEGLFEDRVARALVRLGIPAARDVHALAQRMSELEQQLHGRGARSAPAQKAKATAAKKASPAKKAAPRKAAARKKAG